MTFELPDLPFTYNDLEPFMSKETLEFHHDKHHNAYVVNGNKALEGLDHMGDTLEEVVTNAHKQGKTALFNNAGQHWNHSFFWKCLKKPSGGELPANLSAAINDNFGSFDKFREEFIQGGITQFGSGWVWLVLNQDSKLEIAKTANADAPFLDEKTPLLVCDVWEHAYYIDYRNARPKFLEVFIDNLANWEFAAQNYEQAKK